MKKKRHVTRMTKSQRAKAVLEKARAEAKIADEEQKKRTLAEAIIEALGSPTRSWRMRVIEIPLKNGGELWVRAEHISAFETTFAHDRLTTVVLTSGEHYQVDTSAYELAKLIDPSLLHERWSRREIRFPSENATIVHEARPPAPPPPPPPPPPPVKKSRKKPK